MKKAKKVAAATTEKVAEATTDGVKEERDMEDRRKEEKPDSRKMPEEEVAEETDGVGATPGAAESGLDGSEAAEDEAANVKYLRLAADFQNYKKRTERERYERYTDGKKDFAAAMLPIIDNFERALAQDMAEIEDEHDRMFVEGMDMIFKQFIDALAANGVSEIEALGEDFDPNVHHAVVMEPSETYESQKVSEVLQKGFKIGEKVIRPSMVKVAE